MKTFNETLVRAGGKNDFVEQVFRCNINVTDLCNQRCSYCINKDSHNKNSRVLSPQIMEEFIEDIVERVKGKAYFSVAGGEPFLYPHLEHLVKFIARKLPSGYVQIRFLTNGSLLPEAALPLYEIKEHIDLKYAISIHMDFMKFDRFLEKIQEFPYKDDILCKILMAPGQMEKARFHLERLNELGLDTYVSAVSGVPEPYTEAEKAFLQKHENTFVPIDLVNQYEDWSRFFKGDMDMHFKKEYFDYSGMMCAAGINSLRLGVDGKAIPCFGIHALPRDRRPIYDITQKRLRDIPELKKPWICPSTYCFCSPFLSAPKWRPQDSAPAWLS